MTYLFAVALDMGPAEWSVVVISVVGFLAMFGIASAKGDYQGLIKSTLALDEAKRKKRNG